MMVDVTPPPETPLTVAAIKEQSSDWNRPMLEAALEYEQAHGKRKGAIAAIEHARDMLAGTDYQFVEAENGEEALAAVARQRPDLILMDIQLPILDGYEATRRIKADPALRSIPIIAVTSYALSGDEAKARAAGCDDFIPKPYSPRQLLAKVRQYLDQS